MYTNGFLDCPRREKKKKGAQKYLSTFSSFSKDGTAF
jgi:hypothetical protein